MTNQTHFRHVLLIVIVTMIALIGVVYLNVEGSSPTIHIHITLIGDECMPALAEGQMAVNIECIGGNDEE